MKSFFTQDTKSFKA